MPRKLLNRVLATFDKGDAPVQWLLNSAGLHTIIYGAQTKTYGSDHADSHAAAEFGYCVRHSLECAGLLDY